VRVIAQIDRQRIPHVQIKSCTEFDKKEKDAVPFDPLVTVSSVFFRDPFAIDPDQQTNGTSVL
jgi:hypothetical protein